MSQPHPEVQDHLMRRTNEPPPAAIGNSGPQNVTDAIAACLIHLCQFWALRDSLPAR
jgi:hypothetical protein